MRNDSYYTLAFDSTHMAVAAEKYLSARIAVSVMPTPRKITASCGISLRIELEDSQRLMEALESNVSLVTQSRLYMVKNNEVKLIVKKKKNNMKAKNPPKSGGPKEIKGFIMK